jgi:hypothetical protein
LKGRTA